MDDIKRRDRAMFVAELTSPQRLPLGIGIFLALFVIGINSHALPLIIIGIPLLFGIYANLAWKASEDRRFHSKHLKALWEGCIDRRKRFDEVLIKAKKTPVGDLQEMPKTIESVGFSVYLALRRADVVTQELNKMEGGLPPLPKASSPINPDLQAQELFKVADRNIAEYKIGLQGLIGGVQRSEAQAAVFMTTLDTLRIKMMSHRLMGRSPEANSHEFLAALAEAKLQLESIDQALEELDLSVYPQNVSGVRPASPPPIPSDVVFAQGSPIEVPAEDSEQQHLEGRG